MRLNRESVLSLCLPTVVVDVVIELKIIIIDVDDK